MFNFYCRPLYYVRPVSPAGSWHTSRKYDQPGAVKRDWLEIASDWGHSQNMEPLAFIDTSIFTE